MNEICYTVFLWISRDGIILKTADMSICKSIFFIWRLKSKRARLLIYNLVNDSSRDRLHSPFGASSKLPPHEHKKEQFIKRYIIKPNT